MSLLQNHLGLDILETISWGAQWEWGHFKHPPLSGWLGYLFSLLSEIDNLISNQKLCEINQKMRV